MKCSQSRLAKRGGPHRPSAGQSRIPITWFTEKESLPEPTELEGIAVIVSERVHAHEALVEHAVERGQKLNLQKPRNESQPRGGNSTVGKPLEGQKLGTYFDTEVGGMYEAVMSVGKQIGEPSGWKTFEDAHSAVTKLTMGEESPAGAIIKSGETFVAHNVDWQWRDIKSHEAFNEPKPAQFEGYEDHYTRGANTSAARRLVELLDGETSLVTQLSR